MRRLVVDREDAEARGVSAMKSISFLVAAWVFSAAQAAEIKVLAGSAVQPVMNEIIPAFEAKTGHRVVFDYGAVGAMALRAQGGERADAVIVSGPQMDALEKDGRALATTRLDLGRTDVGVFVKKGAPKPDITTVDAFKRAMLAAKSIGYNDPAAGAPVSIYLLELFKRMGIAEQMTPKSVAFKQRSERFEAVARGDVEIGFNQVSEIIAQPSVDLVGPLPEAIQNYTSLNIGVLANAEHPDAARDLVAYLAAPQIRARFRKGGFE
jgi:molybdate transport system substrate-binding protein